MFKEVCSLPDPSDNQTILLVVALVGLAVIVPVCYAARAVSKAIHRLARAMERRNSASAQDLERVRDKISRETSTIVDEVALRLDRHVEVMQGAVGGLEDDVANVHENVARVASMTAEVVEILRVPIAGSTWWLTDDVPLADRLAGRPAKVVTSNVDSRAAYHQDANPHTATMPAQPASPAPYTGDHTQAILTGNQPAIPGRTYQTPPFNPDEPREIWHYMLDQIQSRDPNAWPWTIDESVQGIRYTYYEVFRAQFLSRYNVNLPENMHTLWPNLVQHEYWQQHGPTGDIPQAALPPSN